jgi:hypothetical protein
MAAAAGGVMLTEEEGRNLAGATAYDQEGQKIGEVTNVYLDNTTGDPQWVIVAAGLFGLSDTLVPASLAHLRRPQQVAFAASKNTITSAPQIDPKGPPTQAEADQLLRHYGLGPGDSVPSPPETSTSPPATAGPASPDPRPLIIEETTEGGPATR